MAARVGTATLFAWDCFDALVIDRVPYWKKTQREEQKQMEYAHTHARSHDEAAHDR